MKTEIGNRIKVYEGQTTNTKLIMGVPLYARLDGRAFHTFCRGLTKPFCLEFVETMQETCAFLVKETNAVLGYTQSDEISLGWLQAEKAPFDRSLFKLESVLASLTVSKFINYIYEKYRENWLDDDADKTSSKVLSSWTNLYERVKQCPSFDCRVFQVPNETELANCFMWRELDAVRNSVNTLAQSKFTQEELHGKTTQEIQEMLTKAGLSWNNLNTDLKRGAYFHRVMVEKQLSDDVLSKIPEDKRPEDKKVMRSVIEKYKLPLMQKVENKVGAYFYNEDPHFLL